MSDVTRILSAIEQGDPRAAEQLLPLVYDELRRLAAEKMAQERPGQTLQATALVHEAYLRLVDVEEAQHWDGRGHFFAAAAELRGAQPTDGANRRAACCLLGWLAAQRPQKFARVVTRAVQVRARASLPSRKNTRAGEQVLGEDSAAGVVEDVGE
jgi:hypothetical protein